MLKTVLDYSKSKVAKFKSVSISISIAPGFSVKKADA
jgi:hypothetical protein